MQYETKFFFLSTSTELISIEVKPYSIVEKCYVSIFDNEKSKKIKNELQRYGFC